MTNQLMISVYGLCHNRKAAESPIFKGMTMEEVRSKFFGLLMDRSYDDGEENMTLTPSLRSLRV